MANQEHLAKLKEGVKAWNAWREKNPASIPELQEADLSGVDLSKINLTSAHLIEANLEGANLADATLKDAFLLNVNLKGARLDRADLRGADLLQAKLKQADLVQADLSGAGLIEANLKGATLVGARLHEAILHRAILKKADVRIAHLCGAYLTQANLRKADLSEANLSEADLTEADLRRANLENADLTNANLTKANLKGGLSGKRNRSTNLYGTNFDNANVRKIQYNRWARYQGVRVVSCYGSAAFKRFAQDQDFVEELRGKSKWGRFVYFVWLIFADCGRSIWLWATWCLFFASWFGMIFYWMGPDAFQVKPLKWGLWPMIYYSVVTFTTLGFGDIVPKTNLAALLVMAEVILGYVMLGGLISIFATKLARRS